jgi:hypothetical protein
MMDSKGPSQNISLIPSEGKISPTKARLNQNSNQHMTKSLAQNQSSSKVLASHHSNLAYSNKMKTNS